MKNWKKTVTTVSLTLLLLSIALPTLLVNSVSASSSSKIPNVQIEPYKGQWLRIKTDLITVLFPTGGKKPMFLWWYSNDTNNIYVVKYKGLIEYMTIDYPYYLHKYEANASTIQKRLEAKYSMLMPELYRTHIGSRIKAYFALPLGLHPAYLPFSACQWNLTGPVNVTRRDGVSYISFNFTLARAPLMFKFAENNVMIRCRFYGTEATEDVYGLYDYTVKAGELKMDLVVQNWTWNIDKLKTLFDSLKEYNVSIPKMRTGLALWVDLASINIVDLPVAEQDATSSMEGLTETSHTPPLEPIERNSTTTDMIVDGHRVRVRHSMIGSDEISINVRNRINRRCRLRFARESQPLAGFFDFVNKAVVINSTGPNEVNVTAAYIPAGNHMRLFIGYPYFSNNTLEHDPSIGVETVTPWLPTNLLMLLIGATILIAVAVAVVKTRKKTVNILSVQ